MAGIYIHVPFCASRCIYCDFYSTTLQSKGPQYVIALEQEICQRQSFLTEPVRTLYLGGGTPSQLGPLVINDLLQMVGRHFDLSQCEEITMEANPEDFVTENWRAFHPINRISMGAQSMVDSELKMLNRRHSADHVREAVARLRQAGIKNISLDLMYGLPLQTMESWEYSIDELIKLRPEHISAYNLSVEEGTKLHRLVERGELTPCDDETCVAMATLLRQKLKEAGYEQYEISNYALPGFQSRHNSSYWAQTPYLGLGPGAHSYDGQRLRCWNSPQLVNYLNGKRKEGSELLTPLDLYNERVMLGLRTRIGVPQSVFLPYLSTVQPIINTLLSRQLICQRDNHLSLTESGLALGDEVIRELMILD